LNKNVLTREGLLNLKKTNWNRLKNIILSENPYLLDIVPTDLYPNPFTPNCHFNMTFRKKKYWKDGRMIDEKDQFDILFD
jgi:hypothetical protein